ncbi:hypothetical protein [Paraglaciecola psychrophila]|uniref:Uncharacterized protein n=1 Tax=Paraglaciecola psychrophila 170 TaxID=1129794 RepID=K7AEU4_9ALTE|nr:hypothetical protein [Paraglaciecola psychrophila]AGH46504.1 hypothetical protein C427_4402 [Paraglaciecola psychrophila 170]GAC39168.1 hypothetical protein GPSY_3557 [Paraglaciecola psychrophila 170]
MNKFWRILGFGKTLSKKSRYHRKPDWQAKRLELANVAEKIPNGSNITIGSISATAHATLAAIVNNKSLWTSTSCNLLLAASYRI